MTRPSIAAAILLLPPWPAPIDAVGPDSLQSEATAPAVSTQEDPNALARRADVLAAAGDLKGARDLRARMVEILEATEPETSLSLRDARKVLAGTLFELGDLQGTRRLDEQVLEILLRTRKPDDLDVQDARTNLGSTLVAMGEMERAREIFTAAIGSLERSVSDDHSQLINARINYAVLLQSIDDLDGALAIYARLLPTLEAYRAPHDSARLAVIANTAAISLARGDATAARSLFEQVLEGERSFLPADHPKLAVTRLNISAALNDLGDLEGARALAEEAIAVLEKHTEPGSPMLARARGQLGLVLLQMRDWDRAATLARQALEDFEKAFGPTHKDVLAARTNLANVLREAGDLAGAREQLEGAVVGGELALGPDSLELLTTRMNLALVIFDMGERAEAIPLLESIVALREQSWPVGDPDLLLARRNLAWALAAAEAHERLASEIGDLIDGEFAYVRNEALDSERAGDERIFRRDTDISMLLSYDALLPKELRHTRRLFELIEECRARAAACDRIETSDPKVAPLVENAREARASLAASVLAATENVSGDTAITRDELDRLTAARDSAERALRAAAPRADVRIADLDAERIAASLSPQERVLAFRSYAHFDPRRASGFGKDSASRFVVHVLARGAPVEILDLGDAVPMRAAVDAWRASLGEDPGLRGVATFPDATRDSEPSAAQRSALDELRERILVPLRAKLEGAKLVHVLADDALLAIPFDVLPLDESGRELLGDRALVLHETSLEGLSRPRRTPKADGVLVGVGGVDYENDGSLVVAAADAGGASGERLDRSSAAPQRARNSVQWSPLPATGTEVTSIAVLFEKTRRERPIVLDGPRATREALEALLPRARFLHVATHGFFAADVRFAADATQSSSGAERALVGQASRALCGLVLAGANGGPDVLGRPRGLLSAEEIAGLDLAGCELAVLSACETGFGAARSGMGFASLQSSLHAAGARTVIASLWKVDDAATREIFESFYRRIWVEREPKARALWNAKMELRARGRPVREWGAWILTGDPD